MVVSAPQLAKRAFVKILIAFATQYHVALTLTRESADKDILAAYRRLLKKVHPDKGGKKEDQQKLKAAKDAWSNAASNASQGGRPQKGTTTKHPDADNDVLDVVEKAYQIQAQGVMLTYHGLRDQSHWLDMVAFFTANMQKWKV